MIDEQGRAMMVDDTGQAYPVGEPVEGETVEGEEGEEEEEPIGQSAIPTLQAPAPSRLTATAQQAGEALHQLGAQIGAGTQGLLARVGERIEPPSAEPAPPGDNISDLFEGPDPFDNDVYIKDLVSVPEEAVYGVGGQDMSDLLEVTDEDIEAREEDIADLLEVSEEDIMGNGDPSQERPAPPTIPPSYRPRRAAQVVMPPAGLARMQ
jgi:hypothetical protein